MITVLIRIRVTDLEADRFAELTLRNCLDRQQTSGCLRAELLRDQADPRWFTMIDCFTDQAAIDAYYATPGHKVWRAVVDPFIQHWECSDQTLVTGKAAAGTDPSFDADGTLLRAALDPVTHGPPPDRNVDLPGDLPRTGIGEVKALEQLAPLVLGQAQELGRSDALAHMDPPTPWITWVTSLWNASVNQNLLHPDLSPAAMQIEHRLMAWLTPLFGMTGGHMTSGSTVANLTALWAARDLQGVSRVIASEHAHLSVGKAAHILGLEYLRVPADEMGRIQATALPADLGTSALVLTAGATSTGAIDPLDLAGRAAWTHVDAAWAAPMRLSPVYGARLDGLEAADSLAISGHKWFFQPKDSGMVLFREARAAHRVLAFGGAYLASPNVGVQGSRGASAVPLLATLLAWGRDGLVERVERSMKTAETLFERLAQDDRATVFAPPETGVFLWRPTDADPDTVLQLLPKGMSSITTVRGQDWVRQVAANPMADADAIWGAIDAAL